MTRQVPTRRLTQSEAVEFFGKAEEFLRAAQEALKEKLFTAACSCAVHAGINASDAITGFELECRSSGKNHEQALVLLKEVAGGKRAITELTFLLKIRPKAEYEPRPIRRDTATSTVERARKLVEIARQAGVRAAES